MIYSNSEIAYFIHCQTFGFTIYLDVDLCVTEEAKKCSLSVGHYELCRDDIGDLLGRSSLTKEKTPMKLASGFCIPEPLPVHTGLKRRQVHPLIFASEPSG